MSNIEHRMDFLGGVLPAKPVHRRPKTALQCFECGHHFTKAIPKSLEVECPHCGSVDVEVD